MDNRRGAVTFRIEGTPIAQPRHRASCRGGFAKLYLPKDHGIHAWKEAISSIAIDHIASGGPFEGPVKVDLLFAFKARTRRECAQYRVCKPDIDNLAKAALDALTDSGAWNDDSQVVQMHAAKMYAAAPFMQVRIEALDFNAVATP